MGDPAGSSSGSRSNDPMQQMQQMLALMQQQQQQMQLQQQQQMVQQQQKQARQEAERIEGLAVNALQAVEHELKQFKGQNVLAFIRLYEGKMVFHGVPQHAWSRFFSRLSMQALHERIGDLYRKDADWTAFKKALREEFFLEDTGLVTKIGRAHV